MTSGSFLYEVRVLRDDEEIASRMREFMAVAKTDLEASAAGL